MELWYKPSLKSDAVLLLCTAFSNILFQWSGVNCEIKSTRVQIIFDHRTSKCLSPLATPRGLPSHAAPERRLPSQPLPQGNMSLVRDEAEWQPSVTGEPSAGAHSHTLQPSPESSTRSPYLENLGAQFNSPSASRRESYDTNLSGDEAFAQAEASATTPRADPNSWLPESPNGGRPTHSPPTPRLSPVHELAYLIPSEYAEFERRRAERNKRKNIFGRRNLLLVFCHHRSSSRGKRRLALLPEKHRVAAVPFHDLRSGSVRMPLPSRHNASFSSLRQV